MVSVNTATHLDSVDIERVSRRPRRTPVFELSEVRHAAVAAALFLAGLTAQLLDAPPWVWWSLYLACYAVGGWEPGKAGLRALRAKTLDVDLLMVVAAVGAAAIGEVLDGGLLIVIFAISGALEALATQRTADSVSGLLDLAPEQATLVREDGSYHRVAVRDLRIGDVIVVRPGERVGADGDVIDGISDVDQATITGEGLPIAKSVGDEVFAATVNGTGMLRVRVSRDPSDTVVARIVAMVEEASATKAKTQLFIEKIEQRYSIGVVAATLALFFVPLAFGADLHSTLLRAMTFMIVASPCAVVLSTMPPLLSSIANSSRHGVLVKSAVVMEQLGHASMVAFDKTGTLTHGSPRLAEVSVLRAAGLSERAVLGLAAAAERHSEHPLAGAIVAGASDRGIDQLPASDFRAHPGRGVSARVDGHHVAVGSPAQLLRPEVSGQRDDVELRSTVADLESEGRTVVVVLVDGAPVGVLGLADRVRADARETVARLRALTGASPIMLTGDNPRAARRLADEVGITDVRAGLLPQDKVAVVRELEASGEKVLLVGDGINDAPALATAHSGLAMGQAGADVTLQTADAVVIRDELATVPALITLSRRARRLVVANLAIAATFIVALVTWDLIATLPLPVGVAFHEGSTVLVALNGLRLLRSRAWRGSAS